MKNVCATSEFAGIRSIAPAKSVSSYKTAKSISERIRVAMEMQASGLLNDRGRGMIAFEKITSRRRSLVKIDLSRLLVQDQDSGCADQPKNADLRDAEEGRPWTFALLSLKKLGCL